MKENESLLKIFQVKKLTGYEDMTLYQYNFSCPGLDDYLASKGSRIDIKEAFQFFENVHQEGFLCRYSQ